jgi:predicted glutamate--cysteine ligase
MTKGLEEEVYTGTADGRVVGLSHLVAADLPGFATEPDARNVEYITDPTRSYDELIHHLMCKRCRLRRYLAEMGRYVLVPGGTLSLETSDAFQLSNEINPYYLFIRDTYGTRVVTASTHINVGVEQPEELMRASRVLRCEASMYLALTACSPFLAGEVTGYHSTRWHIFPTTPARVPFFADHAGFVAWQEEQLATGAMQNPRHLWLSVRPNGPDAPYQLSRLELRICDRISEPELVNAVVALFEARIWEVLEDPDLDPLRGAASDELERLAAANEESVARSSLDAEITDWQSGQSLRAREWIERALERALPLADRLGFSSYLAPIRRQLEEGNLAMQWLAEVERGATPQAVLAGAIEQLTARDVAFDPDCLERSVAVGGCC